jgi:CxxC motif-containing protein (DUF1111 family)
MNRADFRGIVLVVLALVLVAQTPRAGADRRGDRFRAFGSPQAEFGNGTNWRNGAPAPSTQTPATEAATGFDNSTNGYLDQGPPFDEIDDDSVVAGRSFNDNRFVFEEVETAADGLGPTYNAQSCAECHQNVATGGASQVTEHRTGRANADTFFEAPGGSLIQSRATYPDIVERVQVQDDIRTFRISTNTLGAGYVEAIANTTLLAIRDAQPASMRGTATMVAVLEADGAARVGRFGWKSQHASLQSFAADAYLNEMGITSPLLPDENTSSGRYVGFGTDYDPTPEPEDDGTDVVAFADFMRSTKAPSRGPITPDVTAGERVFGQIGCATCHVASITTTAPGAPINGGEFVVPVALGNKIIHPYSDFLLHDIGSGDGIPLLPTPELAGTATQMRTAPLWGLRTRNRLMHDGLSFTYPDVIRRHAGQAAGVTARYNALSSTQKKALAAFLDSL